MEEIRIEKVSIANETTFHAIRDLLMQLYPEQPPLLLERFQRVVQDSRITVYIALVDEHIIGTSQLAHYEKLGGDVWTIEDVVVDQEARGKGVGKKLTERMLHDARSAKAKSVDLTTRREDARRFYIEKCGFQDKSKRRPFWGLRHTF